MEEEGAILADRATSMAQMKRLSGRKVTSLLSRMTLGLGRQERASVGPLRAPGVWMKWRSKSCKKSIQHAWKWESFCG